MAADVLQSKAKQKSQDSDLRPSVIALEGEQFMVIPHDVNGNLLDHRC